MKMVAIVSSAIVFCSLFISCKGKGDIDISIKEVDKELTIKVDAVKNGENIQYDKTFDITGWSKAQKDSFIHHILDSLQVDVNESK